MDLSRFSTIFNENIVHCGKAAFHIMSKLVAGIPTPQLIGMRFGAIIGFEATSAVATSRHTRIGGYSFIVPGCLPS
jgi:hypothetical protein